jgi:hypothetical protein
MGAGSSVAVEDHTLLSDSGNYKIIAGRGVDEVLNQRRENLFAALVTFEDVVNDGGSGVLDSGSSDAVITDEEKKVAKKSGSCDVNILVEALQNLGLPSISTMNMMNKEKVEDGEGGGEGGQNGGGGVPAADSVSSLSSDSFVSVKVSELVTVLRSLTKEGLERESKAAAAAVIADAPDLDLYTAAKLGAVTAVQTLVAQLGEDALLVPDEFNSLPLYYAVRTRFVLLACLY